MKRSVIKISLAILVVVVAILLSLLAALTYDSAPEMSFAFLDGRAMTARVEPEPGSSSYRTTRDVYSFEADFNDVCTNADADLSAMGFKIDPFGSRGTYLRRQYQLANATSARSVVVSLRDGAEFRVYSTPKSSKYSSPDRYEYHRKNGWVSVEIARRRLRSWPPQYFLNRLFRVFQRAGNKPPPQKKNAGAGNRQGRR